MEQYIGKHVTIIGKHPHTGESGTAVRTEIAQILNQKGLVIDLDDGGSCFIFDPVKNLIVDKRK